MQGLGDELGNERNDVSPELWSKCVQAVNDRVAFLFVEQDENFPRGKQPNSRTRQDAVYVNRISDTAVNTRLELSAPMF